MRKLLYVALGLALNAALGAALAGEAPQWPETKRIGVVFFEQVFKNYQYAKDTEERLRTSYQPEEQKLEAEANRIQEMERALQNNPLKPQGSPAWRKSMMEIESAKVEAQSFQEEYVRRFREENAVFWQNMFVAFQRACRVVAEYYKFDMIVTAPDPGLSEEGTKAMDPVAVQQEFLMRNVQYVNERANLTKSVIDVMNHRYQQYLQDPNKNPL